MCIHPLQTKFDILAFSIGLPTSELLGWRHRDPNPEWIERELRKIMLFHDDLVTLHVFYSDEADRWIIGPDERQFLLPEFHHRGEEGVRLLQQCIESHSRLLGRWTAKEWIETSIHLLRTLVAISGAKLNAWESHFVEHELLPVLQQCENACMVYPECDAGLYLSGFAA